MHSTEARDGSDPEQTATWLSRALDGSGCRAMERYLHNIERRLDCDNVHEALALSAALPEICSMLEHPQLRTSPAHCVCWCDAWVAMDGQSQNVFPLTRVYLRDEEQDAAQWISTDERFARSVSESLLGAARTWYTTRGAYDITVQYNLGKISGH